MKKKDKFKCKECNRVFKKMSQLKQHEVVHLPFGCDDCGKRFKREAQLQNHMKQHDPERKKDIKCDVCGREFFELRTMERHKKTHEEGKYACDECGERFRRGRSLIAHKKRQHNQNKTSFFACSECPKVFDDEKKFQRHLTTHTPYEERKFVCDQCGKRFLTKRFLDVHQRRHEDRDRSFMCKECGKGFLDAMSLNNHQKTHMKYDDRPVICETCGDRFQDNTQLKSHIWYKHTEKETFDCERCGMSFLTEDQLTRHLNNKTMCKERKIRCPYCDKSFPKGYQLKIHKQAVHKDIVEFQCPQCEETFGSLLEMEKHKQVHEDKFTCQICNKTLYTLEGFNYHMNQHEQSRKETSPKKKRQRQNKETTRAQKYVCEDCNKSFSSMIKLNEHRFNCGRKQNEDSSILEAPTNSKPEKRSQKCKTDKSDKSFVCKLCDMKLASKVTLLNHLRFACPNLEENFTCRMCNSGEMNLLPALIHVAECKGNCEKIIQCNYCLKELPASNYPLHIHMEIVKFKMKEPCQLKCKHCTLPLPNRKILLLHQKMCKPPPIKQTGLDSQNNFICGNCNWTSTSDQEMITHVEEAHCITITGKDQEKSRMPISLVRHENKANTYRFKPRFRCFVCDLSFYCKVAGKFHVRSCQKRYGTVKEPLGFGANEVELQQQDKEEKDNSKTSPGTPRLVLVTF